MLNEVGDSSKWFDVLKFRFRLNLDAPFWQRKEQSCCWCRALFSRLMTSTSQRDLGGVKSRNAVAKSREPLMLSFNYPFSVAPILYNFPKNRCTKLSKIQPLKVDNRRLPPTPPFSLPYHVHPTQPQPPSAPAPSSPPPHHSSSSRTSPAASPLHPSSTHPQTASASAQPGGP